MQMHIACEFIDFAMKCNTFPECKMQAILEARGDFLTKDFYESNVKMLIEGNMIDGDEFNVDGEEYIDHLKIARFVHDKLMKIPWIDDYVKAMIA